MRGPKRSGGDAIFLTAFSEINEFEAALGDDLRGLPASGSSRPRRKIEVFLQEKVDVCAPQT